MLIDFVGLPHGSANEMSLVPVTWNE